MKNITNNEICVFCKSYKEYEFTLKYCFELGYVWWASRSKEIIQVGTDQPYLYLNTVTKEIAHSNTNYKYAYCMTAQQFLRNKKLDRIHDNL